MSQGYATPTKKTTRVEIIDETGRVYVNNGCKNVSLSFQDDGRTLKIFLVNCDKAKTKYMNEFNMKGLI